MGKVEQYHRRRNLADDCATHAPIGYQRRVGYGDILRSEIVDKYPLGSDIQPFFGVGFGLISLTATDVPTSQDEAILVEDRTVQYNELSFGLNFRF